MTGQYSRKFRFLTPDRLPACQRQDESLERLDRAPLPIGKVPVDRAAARDLGALCALFSQVCHRSQKVINCQQTRRRLPGSIMAIAGLDRRLGADSACCIFLRE